MENLIKCINFLEDFNKGCICEIKYTDNNKTIIVNSHEDIIQLELKGFRYTRYKESHLLGDFMGYECEINGIKVMSKEFSTYLDKK